MPDTKKTPPSKSERIFENDVYRLSAALEAANIGVFELNHKIENAYWDPLVSKIWGLPDDEDMTFKTLITSVHPDDAVRAEDMMTKAVDANGDGLMDMECRVIPRNGDPMRWVRVVATCFFEDAKIVLLRGAVLDITEKRTLEAQNNLLINELQHRVKNTLATVLSVIRLSKPKDNDIENYIVSLEDRLMSMSNTHSLVNSNDGKSIDIKTIIEKEFLAYVGPKQETYNVKGPSLYIPQPHVQIISMAIHELVTNATKHGALSVPNRKVTITTSLKHGIASFKWEEKNGSNGLPPPKSHQGQPKGGFGSFLLSKVVSAEVQGKVTYEINSEGLFFNLDFPFEEAARK